MCSVSVVHICGKGGFYVFLELPTHQLKHAERTYLGGILTRNQDEI